MPFHLPLPNDTRAILGDKREALQTGENLGLVFQRFAAIWGDTACRETEFNRQWEEVGRRKSEKINLKQAFLEEVVRLSRSLASPSGNATALLSQIAARQALLMQDLQRNGAAVASFELSLETRLVTGLGSGHPSEAGFAFHRLYGLPCLVASGLKGVARTAATVIRGLEPAQLRELFGSPGKDARFARLFRRGRVQFFDAFPTAWKGMDIDIMNPHYPDYYQGKAPPTEWQSPKPVTFLALPAGTRFRFQLAVAQDEGIDAAGAAALAERARELLVAGLTDLGFGGKSSAGYGLFAPDSPKS